MNEVYEAMRGSRKAHAHHRERRMTITYEIHEAMSARERIERKCEGMLNKEVVGQNITIRRRAQGMTQKELADMLHISYQAVSQWESGKSLPTTEMLYNLAQTLDVTMESLLSNVHKENLDISYRDSGLDVIKMYRVKQNIHDLITKSDAIVQANYNEPIFWKADTTGMKEPLYVTSTVVPGSKARFAREQGFDREICADMTASAVNIMCCTGANPLLFEAQIVCGDMDETLLEDMAKSIKAACEKDGILFGGMLVGAQPINFRFGEYELSGAITGICEKEDIFTGSRLRAGDVLIAMRKDGIDAITYPYIRIMLDRKPELLSARLNKDQSFVEALLQPMTSYKRVLDELKQAGMLHGAFRVTNSVIKDNAYLNIPRELIAGIDLNTVSIPPLYRFIDKQGMIGHKFFPYRFSFGVGMIAAVPKEKAGKALSMIRRYHEGYVIGSIDKNTDKREARVKAMGKIKWPDQ